MTVEPAPNSDRSFAAGTVVTSDYLPWARVLADSFAAHHPGARLVVAVLDDPDPAQLRADDRFEMVRPQDIGLDCAEFGWMSAIYDGFELSCAVKPWLLRYLLTDHDAALYLDADILVCDSLAAIAARAARSDVVLSPHTLEPPPDDGLGPSEENFLRLGQFNAGFLAVGAGAGPFLDWWAGHLRRECVAWSESEPLRFVDQRWLDLAVNYFPIDVLRERGANVAYWNVATRSLTHEPSTGYRVDGQPLLFMHFSGFDPATPDVLSRHAGDPPGVDARRVPALGQLCAEYAARLAQAGCSAASSRRPATLLPGGLTSQPAVRAALRLALVETERSGAALAPDPGDGDAVMAWLRAAVTAGGTPRYLWALRASHADVRDAFAQVPGADEERYLAWSARDGVAFGLVPLGLGGPAAPIALDGARSFVVLVSAAELLADPTLLAGLGDHFSAADDVTLLIHAPGYAPDALAAGLEPVLGALKLDGADAPDFLGLVEPAGPGALAPVISALLTRGSVNPALALIPHAADAPGLRRLADAVRSEPRPLARAYPQ